MFRAATLYRGGDGNLRIIEFWNMENGTKIEVTADQLSAFKLLIETASAISKSLDFEIHSRGRV